MSRVRAYRGRAPSGQFPWADTRYGRLAGLVIVIAALCGLATLEVWTTGNQTQSERPPVARLSLTSIPHHLPISDQFRFITGRSFFEDAWVVSGASTTLRDGLGPMFSARSCGACHQGGGRSSPALQTVFSDVGPTALALRFDDQYPPAASLPLGTTWAAFAVPQAIPDGADNHRAAEGQFQARTKARIWRYPDGEALTLMQPQYRLENAQTEPPALSVRVAPSLDLSATINQVAVAAILALADPSDENGDGISGRVHPALQDHKPGVAGRFGLKARHIDLREQIAAALNEDLGITSTLFPTEACADSQTLCQAAPNGRGTTVGGLRNGDQARVHEIAEQQLNEMVLFLSHLDIPAADPTEQDNSDGLGATLFAATGCAVCHTPSLQTRDKRFVSLFSNLLLHDMGPELADSGHGAGQLGREWRTAPLKNIRLRGALTRHENYLHDGRAQTIEQAIVWHGGEARPARDRFARLTQTERQALLSFVARL